MLFSFFKNFVGVPEKEESLLGTHNLVNFE